MRAIFCCLIFALLYLSSAAYATENQFRFTVDQVRTVVLRDGELPVWEYKGDFFAHPAVPEFDTRRMSGSYLHPIYGIAGEVLTDNAPADHYHHHGLFWRWPHVKVQRPDGNVELFDLWANDTPLKQMFVRFEDFRIEDKAVFMVENGWYIAPETNQYQWDESGRCTSEKVMDEFVTIITHPIIQENEIRSRAIDVRLKWVVGDFPISLWGAEGKSYGGFTIRFRPPYDDHDDDDNHLTVITTPDGAEKYDLYDMPLKWVDFTSRFERDSNDNVTGKRSGVTVIVSPDHPDYPPTWLVRHYGPICIGWPGVNERLFQPGEIIELSYRLWIHDRPVENGDIIQAVEQFIGESR